ncbi:MAG: thiamine phosphate synthase, partial [Chloroflexota bacterium]
KGLYLVLDVQALRGRDDLEVAAAAIAGGAKTIQLRDKQRDKVELLKVAQGLKKLCQEQGVLFIINDHLDLALACDADGLHLGQDDLPPSQARRFLAIDKIVGLSTHSVEQAEKAQEAGADYIALGSIYPTTSKGSVVVIGVETLRQVRQKVSLPVVAIGGINSANASEAIAAGADAVAVIGAVMGVEDVAKAAQRISSLFEDKPG